MPPACIKDGNRDRRGPEIGQNLQQTSGSDVIGDVMRRHLDQTMSVQRSGDIAFGIIDTEVAAHSNSYRTPAFQPFPFDRERRHSLRIVDQIVIFQIRRCLRLPVTCNVVSTAAGQHRHVADLATDQFAVFQLGQSHHCVHALGYKVNHPVRGANVQRHRRIAGAEIVEIRYDHAAGDPTRHVDAQTAGDFFGSMPELPFCLRDSVNQITGVVCKLKPLLRRAHHPGRTLQKLHSQPVLQPLHRAGDGRARQAERFGRTGEVPTFYNLNEDLHLMNPVHANCSTFLASDVKNCMFIYVKRQVHFLCKTSN